MKILFCSYTFEPSVGGIETVGRLLASEFRTRGHEVRVVTETGGPEHGILPVHRNPSPRTLLRLVRWADIVFHNNISLRYAWPLFITGKPWVITHHTWIQQPDGSRGAAEFLKRTAALRAKNIAISRAMAAHLPGSARVLPNPYDAQCFHIDRTVERSRDLIFVGRLVSDKGCDVLLRALESVSAEDRAPSLTVVGEGPERAALEARARQSGLNVEFTGTQTGAELRRLLNQHRILVVPSRWDEPFGLVALEAIACGCAVIGTRGGGLPEAIGPCGVLVKNGDATELAATIRTLLRQPEALLRFQANAEAHLKRHDPATVADRYLELFQEAIQNARK